MSASRVCKTGTAINENANHTRFEVTKAPQSWPRPLQINKSVDTDGLDRGEHAFVNIDRIIKTQTMNAPIRSSAAFAKSSLKLDSFYVRLGDQQLDLPGFLDSTNTDGFLMLHQGKLVHEFYAHGNDASSKHIMMSMIKSVTSLVVGVLVKQRVMDTESKVVLYLPGVNGTSYGDVTIRHLLDMRTGAQYSDDSHDYPFADGEKPTDFLEFILNFQAPAKAPGGPFEYLSVNTDGLGLVIERASGRQLADLVQEHVWQPIGAESDALLTVENSGSPRAAGGMCATGRDIARLGQAILSRKIGSEAWLQDVLTEGDASLISSSTFAPMAAVMGNDTAYRSCWMADGKAEIMAALGIHG